MRVIFCGSGAFAVPALRAILKAGHEVAKIVTQPPRPAGRGGHVRPTPLAQAAEAMGRDGSPVQFIAAGGGVEVTVCPDVNDPQAVSGLTAAKADVICVADFGQFLRKAARRAAPLGAFNLHASLLPELRGAAPVNWAIIRGYNTTGVTAFELVDRMDAGPIYLQAGTDIRTDETAQELRDRLAEIAGGIACRTLELLSSGQARGLPQDEALATLAPRLKKTDGRVDWNADAVTVRNLIHGTWPWPGGQAVFKRRDGREVPVVFARAAVAEGQAQGAPGEVDREGFIAAGPGRLAAIQIQPAGRRLMSWRDFVNGYRVMEGDRFTSVGA
jgi:methionyl-tRNA formyltransferase